MCVSYLLHEDVKRQWCFMWRRLWEGTQDTDRADSACSDEVLSSSISDPEVERRTQRGSEHKEKAVLAQTVKAGDHDVQQLISRFPLATHFARFLASTSPLSLSHPQPMQEPQGNP